MICLVKKVLEVSQIQNFISLIWRENRGEKNSYSLLSMTKLPLFYYFCFPSCGCCFFTFFFFSWAWTCWFLFFSSHFPGLLVPLLLLLFPFFFFFFGYFFFSRQDFSFLINLGNCLLFLFLFFLVVCHFFYFNWTSFFNNGI